MNPPTCVELDYIHFVIAVQKVFSNTEAARCHPATNSEGPAHDAYKRLLHRSQPDGNALWKEVRPCVSLIGGLLGIDNCTLDKFYSQAIELVTRRWSSTHRRVVQRISLISPLRTNGKAYLTCDFQVYNKLRDQLCKDDHLQAIVPTATARGLKPDLAVCRRDTACIRLMVPSRYEPQIQNT